MNHDHSVTEYLSDLVKGDPAAVEAIWQRYFGQLVSLARRKLKGSPRRVLDEDDVLQNVFENFFRQVQDGRFPKLNDREDLWQILAMLVIRKSADQIRRINAEKAGNKKVRGDSINKNSDQIPVIERVQDMSPGAVEASEFSELVEKRLMQLSDDSYRKIALLKLDQYTNQEIADRLNSTLRTIERKLKKIRETWSEKNETDH